MANIHVAGPVIRGRREERSPFWPPKKFGFRSSTRARKIWVEGVYGAIVQAAKDLKMDAALPHSEAQLEDANPEWFFQTVQERISKSAVVVTVFTGGDVSAG